MPLSSTPIESSRNRLRRGAIVFAATVLGTSLVACGSKPADTSQQAASATTATPVTATPAAIKRSAPPLPAPGESGVFARHGGLVANGGAMNFELVTVDGVARVYLYDGNGDVAGPRDCQATLTVDGGKSFELQRKMDGFTVWMEGGTALPASFDARLVMTFDTKAYDVSLRYATSPVEATAAAPAASPAAP